MRIVTFKTDAEDVPTGHYAIARILTPQRTKKGLLVDDWHPVIFGASDEATAVRNAQEWWDAEIAKELARKATVERMTRARKAKSAQAA